MWELAQQEEVCRQRHKYLHCAPLRSLRACSLGVVLGKSLVKILMSLAADFLLLRSGLWLRRFIVNWMRYIEKSVNVQ